MDATNGSWALAIDFGTSYTSAALAAGDGVDLIDLHGDRRVPSLVFLDKDGGLLVGVLAANQSAGAPERVERTPKAQVGRSPILLLGGQAVPVVDAVGALVSAFVEEARRRRGGSAPSAVTLTHPVRWGEHRRRVLLDAATAAGLDAESARLVEEPVAAAAAFRSERVRPGDLVAVYDLGGGTFDAAVLEATETGFVVVGPPGGDDRLGGEEFDERLLAHVGEQIAAVDPGGWESLSYSEERRWRRAHAQLRDLVRLAKETLSVAQQASVYVPGVDREVLVTRAEFERLIAADVDRTLAILENVVEAAGATPEQLTAVYPVGGSSRIPLVAHELLERYGDRVITWDDPQAAVALGAARMARHHLRLLGERPAAPADPVAKPAGPDAAAPEPPPSPPLPEPDRPPLAPESPRHAASAPAPPPRRRTIWLAIGGAMVAAIGVAAALAASGANDAGKTAGGTTTPSATPESRYALGVTCPNASNFRLEETVDRDCLARWFAAYARDGEPGGSADDAEPELEFLRYFDAAFGTQLSECWEGELDTGSSACNLTVVRGGLEVADQGTSVSEFDAVGLGLLISDDDGKVIDVALGAVPNPEFPEPWAVGDGDASLEPADSGDSSVPEQPGPQGPSGPAGLGDAPGMQNYDDPEP